MKRWLDLSVAVLLVVLLAPLLILVALAVWMSLGSPAVFRQQRAGLRGVPFELLKFRTMTHAADSRGRLLPEEQRVTKTGRFLRQLSLDELPELINVIRGEMSLVGPRPLLVHYLARYTAEQARRHDVKPGITGWAQVNGRNALSWADKLALDVWYVNHHGFWLDLRILAWTPWKVLTREGIVPAGQLAMSEFLGTRAAGDEEHHEP